MFKRQSLSETIAERIDARGRESLDRIDTATAEVQASIQDAARAVETTALVIGIVVLVLALGVSIKYAL